MRTIVSILALGVLLWAGTSDNDAVTSQPQTVSQPVAFSQAITPNISFTITIPQMLSYQGKLTDSLGNPVPDGNYQLTFRLYTQETGGSPFWTEAQTITVKNGLFSAPLGAVNPISSVPDAGQVYLSLQVGVTPELTPRLRIVSSAYSYLTERAANADLLQGKDTIALSAKYVDEGQANSVTSGMIVDGTIVRADVAGNFKAPYSDTADYAKVGSDSARVAVNSHKLQGKDTLALSAKFVDEGQANSIATAMIQDNAVTSAKIQDGQVANADLADNAVNSAKIADGTIATADIGTNAVTTGKIADTNVTMPKIQRAGAATGQVIKWTGSAWAPANDSAGGPPSGPAGGDLSGNYPNPTIASNAVNSAKIADGTIATADIGTNAVTTGKIADTNVTMPKIQRAGAATGQVIKWTGSAWQPRNDTFDNAWVRGTPDSVLFTIRQLGIARGGADNTLYGYYYTHTNLGVSCTTGTSGYNTAHCTVSGGYRNKATTDYATVGGGILNTASNWYAAVPGGYGNIASEYATTVAGGMYNTASGSYAAVAGGLANKASGDYAAVAGGRANTASGSYATVGGGYADTSAGSYSFTTNNHSVVPSSYSNSAAFNGQTATASDQTRVGVLSKASGSFTIDHPLEPYGKILNHYFIEGPEMLNIYRGSVVLNVSGRAEVKLPDYFSVLNRNPHIQLTGVGTSDVYVAEKISGNRFVIGGKPGTEVYWQVTGERQDVSAEITRRMMPVEQPKTGELANRMLDDEFLSGCMEQLVREGKASGIDFRTAVGRERYETMKNPPKPERKDKEGE